MKPHQRQFPLRVKSGSVTVTLYRSKNRRGFISYVLAYSHAGRRQVKSFADFEKAHREAKDAAAKLARGEGDVLHLRSADRVAYLQAVEVLRPTGKPIELAAQEYAEAVKLLAGGATLLEAARDYTRRHLHRVPQKSVQEAVQEMLESKKAEGASETYLKVLRFYLGRLAEAFHCPLKAVTTGDLSGFLRAMPVAPRSRNNARQTIGAFFKFCQERSWLPRDHEGINLLPKFKETSGPIEIFTPAEMVKLLNAARPELVPFLAIGAFAGLRSAEIGRLDWREVHLAEEFIEVTAAKAKTASRRIVPIVTNLAAWLAPHVRESGLVMPFANGAKQLGQLAKDSGVAWKKNALRHSFISYRVAAIQNTAQVALEAGNSPQMIFQHYRELVRPADAVRWFEIKPAFAENVMAMPALAG